MRLKSIETLGFKSFADKIKLEFQAGITAIVGPNGCGKSNIGDAFRWVMGEQSAKSLRGGKMQDVIFAGTSHRKPLNFAEVTITLADVRGCLPIDYDEVSISRRLHRNGDSEYFINRHPVRLKDVQELFLDSGLGKDAYSIFEQGEIDRVINLSPLERRYIFEEAAGILRFLQRKKEAFKKLEQTELNVSRVKDIHLEVEKHIIVLEEQSVKARRYKEDKASLELLEKAFLLSKWDLCHHKIQEVHRKATACESQICDTSSHMESLVGDYSTIKRKMAETESVLLQQREEIFKSRSAKEIATKEIHSTQERLKELQLKERRWELELESMRSRRRSRHSERGTMEPTQKAIELSLLELEKDAAQHRTKVGTTESELAKNRELYQQKQKELFKLKNEENKCESEGRQVGVRLENANDRCSEMKKRKEHLEVAETELTSQIEQTKKVLDERSKAIEEQKIIFATMEQDLVELNAEMQTKQNQYENIINEGNEAKARQKALQRLRDDLEGFSEGCKKMLRESSDKKSPFFGKIKGLFEYCIPEKNAEKSIAIALKPYLQTLVIESKADLLKVIDFAKQQGIKDLSLICLEFVRHFKQTSDNLSKGDPKSLASSVSPNELSNHLLQDTFAIDSTEPLLDTIGTFLGSNICIDNGPFIDKKLVISFSHQGENNIFLREAELKALDIKISHIESERQRLDILIAAIQQKRSQVQQARIELDKAVRKAEMHFMEANFSLQKLSSDFEKVISEKKIIENQIHTLTTNIAELSGTFQELGLRLIESRKQVEALLKQTESLQKNLIGFETALKSEMAILQNKEGALRQATDENRKQLHALHVMEVKDLESIQQEKRLEEEILAAQSMRSQLSFKEQETLKVLDEAHSLLMKMMDSCRTVEQQVAASKKSIDGLENKIQEKRTSLKKLENERNHINIQHAQFDSQQQALSADMNDKYRLTIDGAREECRHLSVPSDQLEKQIRSLKHQMESAGDINMTSIEECEKHKTRYRFLNEQLDDLQGSRQELVGIIAQLDEESRNVFRETFESIRQNFKKNFQLLFNGGEADLIFTESADVLEAGIEIVAKPPDKQMRSIQLLSGGEKCLTALALLFAIFEVKPAPFCILDEIDAPLDDINVDRFTTIVKQFADRCQFLIITHNKRTMAIADLLFGISMEEKGVSKLLSMDFSRSESIVA